MAENKQMHTDNIKKINELLCIFYKKVLKTDVL